MRAAYRVAYPVARAWWQVSRPAHRGALVAIWVGERLLLVRQSYQRRAAFPGGGVRQDEPPRDAARRELREELGLDLAPASLIPACETTQLWDGRRDTVTFFEATLPTEPALRLDHREIVAAAFFARDNFPAALSKPVRHYLRWRDGSVTA